MASTTVSAALNRGGAFLITPCRPEDIFTPADVSDDQRLVGQTAEEFVQKEVVPEISALEQHKEGLMAQMLKKAGEIGLLGGAIPEEYGGAGLDKVSSTVLAEKLAAYGSFAVSCGGHSSIGTIPIVYFGTEAQKKKYLPLLPLRSAGRIGFARSTHARGAFSGWQELDTERAKDVDNEWRLRRCLHRIRKD